MTEDVPRFLINNVKFVPELKEDPSMLRDSTPEKTEVTLTWIWIDRDTLPLVPVTVTE